ncbi:MAG: DUF424 family protein [Candidatus Thermoplasmatota archaeon]|nr:DUF424 family protein [Candidatus Thermoplasmatota archaeon]
MPPTMISIKVYNQGRDVLIGACDEELLGKKFSEGKFLLDVCRRFYEGKRITLKALQEYLEIATIANLVGEQAVQCAVKMGLVDPDCIIRVKGIPHAQMVRMFI